MTTSTSLNNTPDTHDLANCKKEWCAECAAVVQAAEKAAAPKCIYEVCDDDCTCSDKDAAHGPDMWRIALYRNLVNEERFREMFT